MSITRKGMQWSAVALGALIAASAAQAQQAARESGDAGVQDQQQAKGRLRAPTRDEVTELLKGMERSLSQSSSGLTPRPLPSGATAIDLEGRFESVAMARLAADGSVAAECVTNETEAREFLTRDLHTTSRKPSADGAAHESSPQPSKTIQALPLEEK